MKKKEKTQTFSEKTITKKILDYLNSLEKCRAIKMHSDGMQGAGEPDIFCCYHGCFVVFEVKTNLGKATKLQKYILERWNQAEGIATIVRSVEDVKYVLERI